jgi:hypothetical protein
MSECERLLRENPSDDWSLNATGGTKLMSSPAIEVFTKAHRPVYYVETPQNRLLVVRSDWSTERLPFRSEIDLETYFSLFDKCVESGLPTTGQEQSVYNALCRLDCNAWPSVRLYNSVKDNDAMAEFDIVALKHYQLYVFECKRLNATSQAVRTGRIPGHHLQRAKNDILTDLYKLAEIRQSFGGPFGKTYWIFSGRTKLSDINLQRIADFNINLIVGNDVNQITKQPENFGLPQLKPKK